MFGSLHLTNTGTWIISACLSAHSSKSITYGHMVYHTRANSTSLSDTIVNGMKYVGSEIHIDVTLNLAAASPSPRALLRIKFILAYSHNLQLSIVRTGKTIQEQHLIVCTVQ